MNKTEKNTEKIQEYIFGQTQITFPGAMGTSKNDGHTFNTFKLNK